jgi:hypothetical protein
MDSINRGGQVHADGCSTTWYSLQYSITLRNLCRISPPSRIRYKKNRFLPKTVARHSSFRIPGLSRAAHSSTRRWDGISRQNRPVDDGRNHNYNEIHIRIHCSLSSFLENSLVLPFDLCNNICQSERDTVICNSHVREAVIYKC